jgi:ribosomal protein S18 acetylase RimI-like enzyme
MRSSLSSTNDARREPVKIRQMDIDDVARVFHLGERLFEAESMPNLYRTWDEFEVIELFNGDTENCLVAEVSDDIIGFALGTTVSKSRSAWKYGHLIWLGVDGNYQRDGVAERLFHRFRSVMLDQGVRMLIVDTEAENLSALRFFRKMGFGSPQQHIYLSLNLAAEQQQVKKRAAERRAGDAKDHGHD